MEKRPLIYAICFIYSISGCLNSDHIVPSNPSLLLSEKSGYVIRSFTAEKQKRFAGLLRVDNNVMDMSQ